MRIGLLCYDVKGWKTSGARIVAQVTVQRVLHELHDNPVGAHGEIDTVHVDVVLP